MEKANEERKKSLETFCTKRHKDTKDGGVPSRKNFITPTMQKQRLYVISSLPSHMKVTRRLEHRYEDEEIPKPVTLSDTFLIRVGVYESLSTYMTHRSRRQEFLVTNKNFLTDLLNHPSLSCLQDEIDTLGDDDHDEENEMLTHPRHLYIEGTFYTEDSESCEPTLKWLRSHPQMKNGEEKNSSDDTTFQIKKLENVRFGDLTIRLGARYLYKHQIDCEHLFVFQDIRLFHKGDDLDSLSYPLHVHQYKMTRKNCGCCDYVVANLVVYDDLLSPSSPFFYCDKCFEKLHCDEKGDLIEGISGPDFKWYPYIHG